MKKYIELKKYNAEIFDEEIDGIYFGAAFCQNLIPDVKETEIMFLKAREKNIRFVLNTPFVTDEGIKKVLSNIESLHKSDKSLEIIFNDWGVFFEIRQKFPEIKLVPGRLITKQRTDPNARDVIKNMQTEKNGMKIQKVPESIYAHFQGSLINDKEFQNFLQNNNIKRIELEYLIWDMKIELSEGINASVYYPYAHIAVTRNCGLLNMTYEKCNKICSDVKIKYGDEEYPFDYTIIGNTVYYNIENIMTENELKKYPAIDRIVFNDIDAYKRYVNANRNK